MKSEIIGQNGGAIGRLTAAALTLTLLLTNARAADPGAEPKAAPEALDVEVFRDARPLRAPGELAYPASEKHKGNEGWVMLEMMIDPKGKPYEITVVDSTGNAALEQAAIKAAERMPFEPAKVGSTPIDSSLYVKLVFSTNDAHGASEKFQNSFKRLLAAIDAGNKEQADTELSNLQPDNLYEDAFRSYGKYLYDHKWGTETEQLTDLGRTIAGEWRERYLPKDVFIRALVEQLALQIKLREYASALNTWKTLEPLAPTPMRDKLRPTIDQIIALRNSDQLVTTHGQLDKTSGTWQHPLFKSHFAISGASGAVYEIKLRCKKQYVSFKYDPALEYTVSPKAGECSIQVVGDPGTTFDLAQS